VVRQGNAASCLYRQVDWIDAADNYLQLHVGERTHLCRGTLNDVEEELDPSEFVRIHRSVLVAIGRIVSVRPRESGGHVIELTTGARLNASRGYADRVRNLLR
jgi:two-component system LytT family response regulator